MIVSLTLAFIGGRGLGGHSPVFRDSKNGGEEGRSLQRTLLAELGFVTCLAPAVSVFGTQKRVIRFRYFVTFLKRVIRYRYFGTVFRYFRKTYMCKKV